MSPVRLMPLGDSITAGFLDESHQGGYRGPLYDLLAGAGYDVEMVGTQRDSDIKHGDHEGHPTWTAGMIRAVVFDRLSHAPADIVLLHIGTNDITIGQTVAEATKTIAAILDEIDRYEAASNTSILVILAQIINRRDRLGPQGTETSALNRSLASMAAARITAGDRLAVANFEPALCPSDLNPDGIHPNAIGYGRMAVVWFEALIPALGNTVPPRNFTLDVLTGLAVGRDGVLRTTSVVDLEYWKPLTPIGAGGFHSGAPIAMAKQTDGVLTAVGVNSQGRLVVASVGGVGIWQPPVGISDAIFDPVTHVALAKQTDGILTALAIDSHGRLNVASVAGLGIWKKPVAISDDVFLPGVPIAMAKQTDGILTALAVDKFGRLVVASVAGIGAWKAPVGISDAIFNQRTHVAMAKQTDGILTALAIDAHGRMVVTSVPGLGVWQRPVGISDPIFDAGAPIAMAKQTDGILTALAVSKAGHLMVTSVPGLGAWQKPVGISAAIYTSPTPVAMVKQTANVLSALAVDSNGHLTVTSVADLGAWHPPVAISSAIFDRGADVALAKQVDGADLATFLRGQPAVSGSAITQRIAQLTGGYDPEYHFLEFPNNLINQTQQHRVKGVDLGANTVFHDKTVFFFGDVPTVWQQADDQSDWVAYTSDQAPTPYGFRLHSVDWPGTTQFHPYSIKGIGPLGIAQTPTGAFSYSGSSRLHNQTHVYVFAFYNPAGNPKLAPHPPGGILTKTSDPTEPNEYDYVGSVSTLYDEAKGRVDPATQQPIYSADSGRFFQIAPWVVNNADVPGLPSATGEGLILLGQGGPNNTVHMAWLPLTRGQDPDLTAVQYRAADDHKDRWSRREADAKNLFSTIGYTALSLEWLPEAKRWLLLYGLASPGKLPGPCAESNPGSPVQHNPNGPIVARLAVVPWEWSDEIIVFDPLRDNALGRYMHRHGCDTLDTLPPVLPADPNAAYGGKPGWGYGAFLLTRYTKWTQATRSLTIHYLMSTAVPYQVQLMRSTIHVPAD